MSSERDTTTGAVLVDPLGGLLLDPSNELRFKGPFDDYVTVSLSIKNPTEKRIAFKIKTTAPKRYCVKPNSGVLDPLQSMKVNVLLQPFNYDPSEKNKHKFMVQYLYLNDDEMHLTVNDILNMWKDIPATRLLDLKLKCVFEISSEEQKALQQSTQSNVKQQSQTSQQQQQQKTTAALANKTSHHVTANSDTINLTANNDSNNDFNSTLQQQQKNVTAAATATAVSVSNVASKNDNTINELKLARQENGLLKNEINRLKEEVSHFRKMAISASSSSSPDKSSGVASGGSLEINSLADILNNRLVMLVIVLMAVIVYLLLFK